MAWCMDFFVKLSPSFSTCRTPLLDLFHARTRKLTTFLLSPGSSTSCQYPNTSSLISWYRLIVHSMACRQVISQTYWSPRSLLALCVLWEELPDCAVARQDSNHNYGNRRFAHAAPTLWNSLPLNVRNAHSWNAFNRMLKTHLFSIAI